MSQFPHSGGNLRLDLVVTNLAPGGPPPRVDFIVAVRKVNQPWKIIGSGTATPAAVTITPTDFGDPNWVAGDRYTVRLSGHVDADALAVAQIFQGGALIASRTEEIDEAVDHWTFQFNWSLEAI